MKISVIVPTYNTDPEALKRLIGSIDAQTMCKEEYELIFIDDGSTTNIFEKLTNLANKRSNMIVKQIPNSGWGSRPRNIATKMAKGHYVLYLDHDDYVYPEAFERVYNYGILHGADVVNAKEVRTNGWSWGWDQFKENNPTAEKIGIQSLLPMTPHKFYRREFLLENEIEFNEGARVLWEDVYFNTTYQQLLNFIPFYLIKQDITNFFIYFKPLLIQEQTRYSSSLFKMLKFHSYYKI